MSDVISIKGIHGFGYHGVFDHEAKNGQDFYVDLEIALDLSKASTTDNLEDTIDYGALADLVLEDRIKASHPKIERVSVTVHKPKAPVSAEVADIAVTISR
jgi:dihydroneopterin aldolase